MVLFCSKYMVKLSKPRISVCKQALHLHFFFAQIALFFFLQNLSHPCTTEKVLRLPQPKTPSVKSPRQQMVNPLTRWWRKEFKSISDCQGCRPIFDKRRRIPQMCQMLLKCRASMFELFINCGSKKKIPSFLGQVKHLWFSLGGCLKWYSWANYSWNCR